MKDNPGQPFPGFSHYDPQHGQGGQQYQQQHPQQYPGQQQGQLAPYNQAALYQPQYPPQQVLPKSPGIALLISFFLPGVGSMYAGRVGKGVGLLVGYLVAWITCVFVIGFVLAPIVWIWGMVAAYRDAQKWNAAHNILS